MAVIFSSLPWAQKEENDKRIKIREPPMMALLYFIFICFFEPDANEGQDVVAIVAANARRWIGQSTK
jgi:hypothetical protein